MDQRPTGQGRVVGGGGLVLAVGSINADFVFSVHHATAAGETLLARRLLRTSGGKAANRAVQARRLGVDARLLGCVGDDDLADQAVAGPLSAGVDTASVGTAGDATGVAAIHVDDSGEKGITLAANANEGWPADYRARVRDAIAGAPSPAVVACDLELPSGVPGEVLRAAATSGLPVVVDPSPPERAGPDLWVAAGHVTPNAREAAALTGIEVESPTSAAAAGAELVARGAEAAYVKLPSGGCVLVQVDERPLAFEAPEVAVVDATGAGDAFAGALAAVLAGGESPEQAAVMAVAASACAVGGHGSQESYGERNDLERMRREVRSSVLD